MYQVYKTQKHYISEAGWARST